MILVVLSGIVPGFALYGWQASWPPIGPSSGDDQNQLRMPLSAELCEGEYDSADEFVEGLLSCTRGAVCSSCC